MHDLVTSLSAAGILSFERSLQVSEALMHGVKPDGSLVPILVVEKGVRGQTSNDFESEDAVKKGAAKSNIQTVEAAYVPVGCVAAAISFSLRVMPGSVRPHACNVPAVGASYRALSEIYADRGGYHELAGRYVWNLLNGRVAWRNAFQSDDASVTLTWGQGADETLTVKVKDEIGRQTPLKADEIAAIPGVSESADLLGRLEDLVDRFALALAGRDRPLTIEAVWTGTMRENQEVFPSQEYLRDEANDKKQKKEGGLSRVYAKIMNDGQPHASIHSQKIGAAIRCIDDWHGRAEYGAIAVNPYSGVQETGEALRLSGSFFDKRKKVKDLLKEENAADLHFIMANLVRGGVLGTAKK